MVTARVDPDKIDTIAVLQLAASDPPGRLSEWLSGAGLRLDVRDLAAGDPLPAGPQEHAGLVVLGGPMGAADDQRAPYLPAVRALLRDAVSAEQPTLAVCLGAQLLALAHGGRIDPNPDGPELGAQLVAKRTAAATDPLWGPLPITPDVVQWHFDAITALPAGAILLAGSPLCENQAFRLGRLAWGVQFHIETTPEIVRARARADAATLLADYDTAVIDRIVERAAAVHPDVAEVWQPFVAAFTGIVRDPDSVPSPRTVPASTAAPVTDPAAIRAALAAEAQAAHGGPPGSPHRLPMPGPRPHDTDG
ncbi:MAG TPA: type 1 glutamine amidotransferase [Jatrophihabitantaceae bacterium]|nr:type 1 glutamine amidotransferase [Jatrophihabitantaceae bacterium]